MVFGQYETTMDTIQEDSVVYESTIPDLEYDPNYHFDDSAQSYYNRSEPKPEFDRDYWKSLVRDMSFEEKKSKPKDTTAKKEVKAKEKPGGTGLPFMKYLWIIIVILILAIVVYKFLPAFNKKNIRNKHNLVIGLDDLDEDAIKAIEIETPLNMALAEGDYRTAYRLRYLSVLKQLIGRNLILYKKEKTNYEYLLQLTGLPVYEPFRLLTFNFDGIWYGELHIDKTRYELLDEHFVNFNREIGI